MSSTNFKELAVYKKAFALAMEIFHLSKSFPKEEMYSLTDQIRRSSRSVCTNVGESYRKRQYPAHFVSKVSDSDMENTETQVWLDFAKECGYITSKTFTELLAKSEEVGRLLNHMMANPDKY
jgi:four helix bundle protein